MVATACPRVPFLDDYTPAPDMRDCASSAYVDNFAMLGTDKELVQLHGRAVLQEAHRRGLSTHELSMDSNDFDLLGIAFVNGARVLPKGER